MLMSAVYNDRHILTQVSARNKDELFHLLARSLASVDDMDEGMIFEGLKSREAMMNTVIAPGIALPHTPLKGFKGSTGIFAVIPQGCDYGGPQPIRVAAMVVDGEDNPNEHLDTLRNFARMARNPRFLEKMLEAKTPQEVLTFLKRFEAQG